MNTDHEAFNVLRPLFFPNQYHRIAGVYYIDGCYIGASTHIRKRLKSHYQVSIRGHHSNKLLEDKILDAAIDGYKINVYYLSENPMDEKFYNNIFIGERNGSEKFYHEIYG